MIFYESWDRPIFSRNVCNVRDIFFIVQCSKQNDDEHLEVNVLTSSLLLDSVSSFPDQFLISPFILLRSRWIMLVLGLILLCVINFCPSVISILVQTTKRPKFIFIKVPKFFMYAYKNIKYIN